MRVLPDNSGAPPPPLVSLKDAEAIAGPLGKPSKMPGYAYGIPAKHCQVGMQLFKIKGSVCSGCYALKGRYVFGNVKRTQERRFASLRHPRWVEAMVFMILRRNCDYFRWHDSGDLQGMWHLMNIVEVALQCPGTKFWVPTRENALIKQYRQLYKDFPLNMCVRVSGAMIDGPIPLAFLNVSTVTTKDVGPNHKATTCPAYTQGGVCGSCRACWDRRIPHVAYPKH